MSDENTMTVAEALSELKRINRILPQRSANIRRYCSKMKASEDEVDHQRDFIDGQRQSAEDLIDRYVKIKLAIAQSNLVTMIEWEGNRMSVAEAILYKPNVGNRSSSTSHMLKQLYQSFVPENGTRMVEYFARQLGHNLQSMEEGQRALVNLVPELYYDPKEIENIRDNIIALETRLDALIDGSNHQTTISI